MTRWSSAAAIRQQLKTVIEPVCDLFGCEKFCPRGCQLYRQGNAVEAGTDLGHERGVHFCEGKIRIGCLSTLNEKSNPFIFQQKIDDGNLLRRGQR
jgi:hypothetical protein